MLNKIKEIIHKAGTGKNAGFDSIKDTGEFLQMPIYYDMQNLPLGECSRKAVECNDFNSNVLHLLKDEKDDTYIKSSMLQIIARDESMIILDPDGNLYNKFKRLLFQQNYMIRYVDIDDENTNTWSFFDHDVIDITNPNAPNDILKKCKFMISIFADEFLDMEEKEEYINDWAIVFSAAYAYVYTNYLLAENKFEKMHDVFFYNTLEELDELFDDADDATRELWFEFMDMDTERIEYLIELSLALLELLMDPDTNTLISNSDMSFTNLSDKPTCIFLNSIPDAVDDNNCINVILNFMLFELIEKCDREGPCEVPVHFLLNKIESFPNLSNFFVISRELKNRNISFVYTCLELDSIFNTYDILTMNRFFNDINYITISKYDEQNLSLIRKYVIELPEEIVPEIFEDNREVLVVQKFVILCKRYKIENHYLFERIDF